MGWLLSLEANPERDRVGEMLGRVLERIMELASLQEPEHQRMYSQALSSLTLQSLSLGVHNLVDAFKV